MAQKAAAGAVGGPIAASDESRARPSDFRVALRGLLRRPPALFGLACCTVVMLCALMPWLLAPMDPLEQSLERYLKAPGYVDAAGRVYWFGTDQQGRDVLSRVVWGSRISLIVGLTTVVLSGLVGVFFGVLAGYKGGWIDSVISRIVDTLFRAGYDGVVSVEHEDPVWSGDQTRVLQGLGIAERTLSPLIVD